MQRRRLPLPHVTPPFNVSNSFFILSSLPQHEPNFEPFLSPFDFAHDFPQYERTELKPICKSNCISKFKPFYGGSYLSTNKVSGLCKPNRSNLYSRRRIRYKGQNSTSNESSS